MPITAWIRSRLAAARPDDEEMARKARVLRVVLFSALALTILMGGAVAFFVPGPFESLAIVAVLLIWELVVITFMLRGRIQLASLLLTTGLCVNALVTSYLFGGVQQVTFSTYVIVILTGGILLGKRAALFLAAVGILFGLGMLIAEVSGTLPKADPLDSATTWAAASATFVWASVVLFMALKGVEEELWKRAEEVRKRRQAQEEIMHLQNETQVHLNHVQALHTIDQAITTNRNLPIVLRVLLEQVASALQVDAASISLHSSARPAFQVAARIGFHSPDMRAIGQEIVQACYGDAGQQIAAYESKKQKDADIPAGCDETLRQVYAGYQALPIVVKDEVRGVLEVFNRGPLEPDGHADDFIHALVTQAAIAVENARLFRELQESNSELTYSYDATIEGWSRALELRDDETEGHSRRVADLTWMLARRLGSTEPELAHIRRGALLHDIGKMAIPDSILLKPGPLNESEWATMKAHPTYAMQLLSPIPFLQPALDIPHCHHEKWDGSGYPRGLKGEEIPFAARVFAVVDVWDALSSDRPYRRAWERGHVRKYLAGLGGSHFDPVVLKAFLAMLGELGL